MYDLVSALQCLVTLLSYCKKYKVMTISTLYGKKGKAQKMDVKVLDHSFKRSTELIYNDSKCNFLRYVTMPQMCAAKQDIEVCFYVNTFSLRNALT